MNKKITKSLKFGIIVILAFLLLYFGLNFLKGINIFSPVYSYYAHYENLGGLVVSSPVYIKGYKVGQVDDVEYDFTQETPFKVKFSVSKDVRIPVGSKIDLYDDGLLGGKALQLLIPLNPTSNTFYAQNDLIEAQVSPGLFDELAELVPKIQNIALSVDSLLISVNTTFFQSESLKNSLYSLENTTKNFSSISEKLNYVAQSDVPRLIGKADNILTDFNAISTNLSAVDYASTFSSLDRTIGNLNTFTQSLNNQNSTLGLLLNDKELYANLLRVSSNADSLLVDLKQNPKRYVHFSVFGRK